MVTLCAWIFDIALASVLNAGRYDLGWYAGRIYGLLAASFVLLVLLLENSVLHAKVAAVRESERRRSLLTHERHEERLRIVHEIDRAIIAEAKPEAIAAAVLQPLRALLGVARANINLIDTVANDVEWFASAGRRRTHIGEGIRFPMHLLGNVAALARGEAQVIDTLALPPGKERDALIETGVLYYMAVPMVTGDQLLGALSFGGERNEFPEEQVAIAHEVATQLAVAIGNARLYERVRRLNAELEQRVQERTDELQSANRELEAFSYSISHDLRAPLRGIIGFADALMEDHGPDLSDEARRKIKIVQDEGRRLGVLIDELLAFSRLGRKPLQKAAIDMAQLARAALDGLHLQPGDSAPAIDFGALPEARGDRVLLGQVWANLLSNAVKFSARNAQPRIEVRATTDAKEHVFLVRDNGAGFDPKYQSKLFGVFQRLHDAAEFPGTGVGLALVQRIVNRHGGRVWAESRPGEGASFFFTLPKDQADGTVSAG
jgi:signal transduction histidine kinase